MNRFMKSFMKIRNTSAVLTAFAVAEKAVAGEGVQSWAKQEGLDQRQGWLNQFDYQASC